MIEVSHVTRDFGTFRAVDDVSFSIEKGEIVGLLGPNGAGKTTTMRMITGYLEPTLGSVKIDGLDMNSDAVEAKSKIGYMPESAQLYSDMIVSDYLEYVAKMAGVDPLTRVPELAQTCGLMEQMHKNIGELSRGNRQRVGLAHALMSNPEILILDEPTSGLDPNQVIGVRDLIKKIGQTKTVIISTHILSEVEAICNRAIIISGGKVVADNSLENLREQTSNSVTFELYVDNTNPQVVKEILQNIPGGTSVNAQESEELSLNGQKLLCVKISASAENDIRPAVLKALIEKGVNVYEAKLVRHSLEQVFRQLTTGGNL